MKVQPARPKLRVAIPEKPGQFLPEDVWTEVPETSPWIRSLRRGDIIRLEERAEKPPERSSKSKAPKAGKE